MDKDVAKGVFGVHGLNLISDTTKGTPVFVEERDTGREEDRDDDPDGVKEAAALDDGDNG